MEIEGSIPQKPKKSIDDRIAELEATLRTMAEMQSHLAQGHKEHAEHLASLAKGAINLNARMELRGKQFGALADAIDAMSKLTTKLTDSCQLNSLNSGPLAIRS